MERDDDRAYRRVAAAIADLAGRWEARPSLAEAAAQAGLSPWHFQREFTRLTGVSPKRFLGCLALDHARAALAAGLPVLEAAYAAGLSGPSRLHDLAVAFEAASPGEIRAAGAGMALGYGVSDSPFGPVFAARSTRGIVRLAFTDTDGAEAALAALRRDWPRAALARDDAVAAALAANLFRPGPGGGGRWTLAPRGTNFQVKVWQALLAIPPGAAATYAAIARAVGRPGAARAVGAACAANPIAVLIPCHRVLRATGALGGYAYGTARKRALLAWEGAAADEAAADAVPEEVQPIRS